MSICPYANCKASTQLGHDRHISDYRICHDLTACLDKRKYVLIVLIKFPIGSRSDPNIMTRVPNLKRLCMCRYICICYETLITN